jgi:hypothetical protein
MKMIFTILMSLMIASVSWAAIDTVDISDDWNKLTTAQRAEMAQIIANKATTPVVAPSVEQVEPWLELVDHLGEGLVKLARDLGVEANTLLKSPVGVITVGLVAYHVMGDDIVELAAGLLWFGLTFPIWLLFFFKVTIPVIDYREVRKKTLFKGQITVDAPVRRKPTFAMHTNYDSTNGAGPDWIAAIALAAQLLVTVIFIA